jgi:chaperonin GroEL (HSP60 family)
VVRQELEAAHDALCTTQATKESTHAEVGSLRSRVTRVCDSVLRAASSEASLASRLREIQRVEKAMADEAYFRALIVLSVVTSHYDNINLSTVSHGFAASRLDEEIDALE